MGRHAAEAELRGTIREACLRPGPVSIIRMPVECNVHVVKRPVPDQVDFAAATFLSRRSIQANDARCTGLFEPVLDSNRCTNGTGAEQVMSAGLTRGLALDRAANRYVILVDSGQGIVFGENADDRTLGAKSCYERGGNSGPLFARIGNQRS
jgi:hypothetical protein